MSDRIRQTDNPRFEVLVNGEHLATHGIERDGVMCTIIGWRCASCIPDSEPKDEWGDLYVNVGGLDSDADEHLGWGERRLAPGDEITVRILEGGEIDDPPERRHACSREDLRPDWKHLFHIAEAEAWDAAQKDGAYRAASLDDEGFVHCARNYEVMQIALVRFKGRRDLVLLEIDPALVDAEIRYENLEGGSHAFPHIYGPVPVEAVLRSAPMSPREDGSFAFPFDTGVEDEDGDS